MSRSRSPPSIPPIVRLKLAAEEIIATQGVRADIAQFASSGASHKNCQLRAGDLLNFLVGVVKSRTELAEELPRLSVWLSRARRSPENCGSVLSGASYRAPHRALTKRQAHSIANLPFLPFRTITTCFANLHRLLSVLLFFLGSKSCQLPLSTL